MRSALLDTLGEDYIRTARAHGLSRGQALWAPCAAQRPDPGTDHRGAAVRLPSCRGIIIENVFFLPGLGRLVFQAITQRDLVVVKSVVMLLVFAVIVVNFLVELSYLWVDPRLRRRMTIVPPLSQTSSLLAGRGAIAEPRDRRWAHGDHRAGSTACRWCGRRTTTRRRTFRTS